MSHQAFSESTPPICTDSTIIESAPTYSSFENFEPGLKLLSNDPSSEDPRLALHRQRKKQQQQQRELSNDTSPQDDDMSAVRIPSPGDSDFVDLLYVVDSAGETRVVDITSTTRPVPPPTPQPASTISSEHYGLPAENDGSTQTECQPPLSAASNPPATTISAGSDSARAAQSAALEERKEGEEDADEAACEAKLMSWWPRTEADELKVERL